MIPGKTDLFDCKIQWTSLNPIDYDISDEFRGVAYRLFLLRNDVVAIGSLDGLEQRPIYPPYKENDEIFLTADGTVLYIFSTYTGSIGENVDWAQKRGYRMEILPKRDAIYCGNAVTVVLYR